MSLWDITKSGQQHQSNAPLHVVGYYLNPSFFYNESFNLNLEVM
jgi:hypothetical protein